MLLLFISLCLYFFSVSNRKKKKRSIYGICFFASKKRQFWFFPILLLFACSEKQIPLYKNVSFFFSFAVHIANRNKQNHTHVITGRSCRLFIRSLSSKIKPCKWFLNLTVWISVLAYTLNKHLRCCFTFFFV